MSSKNYYNVVVEGMSLNFIFFCMIKVVSSTNFSWQNMISFPVKIFIATTI